MSDIINTGEQAASQPKSVIINDGGAALFRSLNGESTAICKVREIIEQVAVRNVPVLLIGESGVGKEVAARKLHYFSGRQGNFMAVNCATLREERIAEELFGITTGAFISEDRQGLLAKAHGGTLYLDYLHELPVTAQLMLLRVLEDGTFQPVGGQDTRSSDVRIIVGSHRDLRKCVEEGRVREDLYFRICVMPIEIPPLRERLDDLPALITELTARLSGRGLGKVSFNSSALASLQQHSWPGNVRELANLVERLSILRPDTMIGIEDLPSEYRFQPAITGDGQSAEEEQEVDFAAVRYRPTTLVAGQDNLTLHSLTDTGLQQCLDDFARQIIEVALADCEGVTGLAAIRLHMEERQLREQLGSLQQVQ